MSDDDTDEAISGCKLNFINPSHAEPKCISGEYNLSIDKNKCLRFNSSDLKKSAKEFIDTPTSGNVFYPILEAFERYENNGLIGRVHYNSSCFFKSRMKSYLEREMDQENSLDVFEAIGTERSLRTSHSGLAKISQRSTSPDLFYDCVENEEISNSSNALKSIKSTSKIRKRVIVDIERFIIKLLEDFVANGSGNIIIVNTSKWENCELSNGILRLKNPMEQIFRNINLKRKNSGHRFAMIMYVLSQVYHLLITETTCTERELYYDDPELAEDRINVTMAVRNVCSILNASAWDLGIRFASKGLVAGAIRIYMNNNVVIDCNACDEGVLVPNEVQSIVFIETSARFVLIIEKDTVFEKLIKQNILLNQSNGIILITGKGYPDISTRLLVAKLWNDFKLPIYALVDADPFGIEIMLVYRFGSKSMVLNSDHLACPHIRWIGVHPSEIDSLAIPSIPQTHRDRRKIIELLKRTYISAEMRNELEILQRLNRKAEIEAVTSFSANFLVSDYIPNKIKRNLCI